MNYETFLARLETPMRGEVRVWVDRWLDKPRDLLGTTFKSEKTQKTGDADIVKVLTLSPADESVAANLCPWSSPACRNECLKTSGHNVMHGAELARVGKTCLYVCFRTQFMHQLKKELDRLDHRAYWESVKVAVRLNNLSDIAWPSDLFCQYSSIQFFDYTKSTARMADYIMRHDPDQPLWPCNYHLTYSVDERRPTTDMAREYLRRGAQVAVVFAGSTLPATWEGFPVVDGDKSDARWLQAPGTVCGLRAKGAAKRSNSGFAQVVTF